ncbi:type IV-A pilus assembly ATPase PilB [Shewanella baltica]|uniref:Type IV-A pilus assembly ATPase PilB n=1 Tax=Shewanella baltica (strain OS155 / ATCC BAA-1091) TaxID=325240 RepID=A3D9H6_SHEB5|nr:type IV-A pilus assembly ATPase PilB [Shewanella baltica]ABN63389.1 type IV-A pilus assembly ATPase PilB [Shewanella baltica OS155]AEH15736.1 type IV-A pilus assembly ATPase PilB [Shewanella baltica OS117]MCS6122555.1 type IV-A pilus assembly ATPase PilB [Shewanella baltica]MCS6180576.1 type IV-A pilus assembly ATPase PilB [Shewanella baltica]MCS6256800.1 type IV-A pilus assembly ATPase PilB [Shewanella baltica]
MPTTGLHLGLSTLFIRKGLLNEEQMANAITKSRQNKHALVSTLVQSKLVSARAIADLCYEEYGTPLLDLNEFDLASIPEDFLNKKLIEKHRCLPLFKRGNRLYIGTSDPTNIAALEDFQFSAGLHAEAILVEEDKLSKALEKILEEDISGLDLGGMDEAALAAIEITDTDNRSDVSAGEASDDAPIVIYINKILTDAIRKGASDLHFEPYEKRYRIRFRIDGILHEVSEPPISLAGRLSARLKVMSKLDIAERRVPQDGRIKMKLSRTKSIDFRVSTLPTLWGEKIVMRILDSSSAQLGIEKLGYEPDQEKLYLEMLAKPQGMILVTGPTGSGKTVSLYTGLNILNTEERNISTAEDPVEINLEGVNQVHINLKAGLTFASALRSFLRQDPDVVMVGEIRDLETAEIAIKAAQTGHLVLSTLHTNSAAETLTRLINMGVPGYNIASSVNLIIAQRLARRLCPECKQAEVIPEHELLRLGFAQAQITQGFTTFKPIGCEHCSAGYKGRVGIYEVMKMSDEIARTIMEGGNSLQIASQAKAQGMRDLRQSGLLKVMHGVTSIAEVNRVTSFG